MNVPVTLQQYAQLVQRINAELASHLSTAVAGFDNVQSISERALESGTIFGARNNTRMVVVKSVLLPFGFDSSNSMMVEVDRAIVVATAQRRATGSNTWSADKNFADNGVMTLCVPSLDEGPLVTAAAIIAEEIKAHLAFERVATCP